MYWNFTNSSGYLFIGYWYEVIDKGNYVGLVMIDLKRDFGTVNHGILLQKLKQFNVSNERIRWFQSYLSERSHNTVVNGIESNSKAVSVVFHKAQS